MKLIQDEATANAMALKVHTLDTGFGPLPVVAPVEDITLHDLWNDVCLYPIGDWVQPDIVVVEVGTGVGLLPVLLEKRHCVSIHYFGVEPIVFNYMATVGTMALNNVHGRVVNMAVSQTKTALDFVVHPTGLGGASSCVMDADSPGHCYLKQVPAVTFGMLLASWGISDIDVLVLDCEGAEHELVAGLDVRVRHVCGELHENSAVRAAGFSNGKTLALLKSKVDDVQVACRGMMDI